MSLLKRELGVLILTIEVVMTTTELIKLLQSFEKGASGRSREISVKVKQNDNSPNFFGCAKITVISTGDGVAGAQIELLLDSDT